MSTISYIGLAAVAAQEADAEAAQRPEPVAYFVKRYRNVNIYQYADGRLNWRIEPIRMWNDVAAVEAAIDGMIIDAAITMSNDEVERVMQEAGHAANEPVPSTSEAKPLADE